MPTRFRLVRGVIIMIVDLPEKSVDGVRDLSI